MVLGPSTPLGHSVNYGKIPYRTLFSVPLRSEQPIAGALVGRNRWDDPNVIAQARVFLERQHRESIIEIMDEQEEEFIRLVAEKWEIVRKLEMSLFPKTKSFFYYIEYNVPMNQAADSDEDADVFDVLKYYDALNLFEQPINGGVSPRLN